MKITDEMLNAFRDAWMTSMQTNPRTDDPERIADQAGLEAVLAIVKRDFVPTRDDAVAAWIKRSRDQYEHDEHVYTTDMRWDALDDLLEDYREHADTGVPLGREVAGPYAHLESVDTAPYPPEEVDRG